MVFSHPTHEEALPAELTLSVARRELDGVSLCEREEVEEILQGDKREPRGINQ